MNLSQPQRTQKRSLWLSNKQRATHTYVIGQPGTGKSRALESWILQDIRAGRGVGVIDPHGDLYQNLLSRLANYPECWDRLILVDPCDPMWVVSFNPLAALQGQSPERVSLFMTDIVMKIWGVDTARAPRMLWLMINTFLALADLGLTLLDLPRFLLDQDFRDVELHRLRNNDVRTYFRSEFPASQAGAHQWVTPVLNKLGSLLFDPDLRMLLAGDKPLDFRQLMDQQRILLVNLPKGILGEGSSALLGAFIVARIQKAALSRANNPHRKPFYLYLDEFQNYTTDNIQDILSESRKYGLSLVMAHQYLDQLSSEMQSAVLNTAGTLVSFRVGYPDARRLVKEFFPSANFQNRGRQELQIKWSGNRPRVTLVERKDTANWETQTQKFLSLKHREFWVKRREYARPNRSRSHDVPDIPMTTALKEQRRRMMDTSGKRFGRLKRDARKGLKNSYPPPSDDPSSDGSIPLWEA